MNFYKAFTLLKEIDEPTPAEPNTPSGDAPAPPPALSGPPPGGNLPAPGEAPEGQKTIDIKTLPVADVWKLLRKIVEDKKYDSFFADINILKNSKVAPPKVQKKSSLQR